MRSHEMSWFPAGVYMALVANQTCSLLWRPPPQVPLGTRLAPSNFSLSSLADLSRFATAAADAVIDANREGEGGRGGRRRSVVLWVARAFNTPFSRSRSLARPARARPKKRCCYAKVLAGMKYKMPYDDQMLIVMLTWLPSYSHIQGQNQ